MSWLSILLGLLSPLAAMFFPPAIAAAESAPWPEAQELIIGRSDSGKPLSAWIDREVLNQSSDRPVLIIGIGPGTDVDPESLRQLVSDLHQHYPKAEIALIRWTEESHFPPTGTAYNTAGERTAATIWRGIAWLGGAAVMEIRNVSSLSDWPKDSLATAVASTKVAGISTAPAIRLPAGSIDALLREANQQLREATGFSRASAALTGIVNLRSPLQEKLRQRKSRSPEDVVADLATFYGHNLKSVMYQPALALIARLHFDDLMGAAAAREEIAKILEPHLAKAEQTAMTPGKVNSSVLAGHLIFAEWAERTGDERAKRLVKLAADNAFDATGHPLKAMPGHNEMSDAVFMACPILVAAGRISGDPKYVEMAVRQLDFMQQLCLRPDGIYRHSPLCEAAWGRGNGFPMLGLALSLTDLEAIQQKPEASAEMKQAAAAAFQRMSADLKKHANALLAHQDSTGMWREVIDEPSAYREMTATCMIGFALQRAINRGWTKDQKWQTAADRAWQAVLPRIGDDGVLLDVCTGTGKQKTLQDYFDRTAILDRDERGGAMALLFAVERAQP